MSKEQRHTAKLKVYTSDEEAERDRMLAALNRTGEERFFYLLKLIKIAFTLNGGKPFKKPDGKHVIYLKKQR